MLEMFYLIVCQSTVSVILEFLCARNVLPDSLPVYCLCDAGSVSVLEMFYLIVCQSTVSVMLEFLCGRNILPDSLPVYCLCDARVSLW